MGETVCVLLSLPSCLVQPNLTLPFNLKSFTHLLAPPYLPTLIMRLPCLTDSKVLADGSYPPSYFMSSTHHPPSCPLVPCLPIPTTNHLPKSSLPCPAPPCPYIHPHLPLPTQKTVPPASSNFLLCSLHLYPFRGCTDSSYL